MPPEREPLAQKSKIWGVNNWSDKLVNALWAYRTTVRTATGQTPYALAFEMEAVVPYEILIPSLRVQIDREMLAKEKR